MVQKRTRQVAVRHIDLHIGQYMVNVYKVDPTSCRILYLMRETVNYLKNYPFDVVCQIYLQKQVAAGGAQ